jgi:hypothetical protein
MTFPPLPSSLIRGVVIMTLLTGTTIIIGCRRPDVAAFREVTPGMSKAEVLERLGQPSSRVKGDLAHNNATWASRWHWGDTLGTLATHAVMPDQPPPTRVWTVWFDASGTAINVEAPDQAHRHIETAPWEPPKLPNR